ncbi:hypothetical protein EV1_021984 [Malus domestica]
MKKLAVEYFQTIFSHGQKSKQMECLPNLFPDINVAVREALTKDIDMVEVKESLFNIGGLKAPGIDGFPACFYQSQWNICANDIFDMVWNAFHSRRLPAGLNSTLITLVPKIDNPQKMLNFRPISLCCTLYKVISKIIVARIRPHLPHLISPNQASFVPGRQISDNVLIAQEILHKFRMSKGQKGFLAWKIDLSKAYDRLNWKFIEYVLNEVGLPSNLIQLMMECVSTVRYQICFNGELTDGFIPQNGIRQGDPLSPYLFVLCIEKLSHLISATVNKGRWKPVKASQSGPRVSHLFFADDLMLFSEATPKQARVMKRCLEQFCKASGQAVNFEKSVLYCSPNTSRACVKSISTICGSPVSESLGNYLGMPLIQTRVSKATYSGVIDKVQKRLATWKSKVLSMAGRITLIQAVTSSIPVYAMQTTKLPASVCEELDKVNRDFLWGDTDQKKKVHLCQWSMVCKPKSKGGLGIKRACVMNQALLAKLGWRIHAKDSGLWSQIYQAKYLKGYSILDPKIHERTECSYSWKGILYGVNLLKKGMTWRIGNGESVKFWKDSWVLNVPLMETIDVANISNIDCVVSEFLRNGWWDIDKLRDVLPEDMVQKIICRPAGTTGAGMDKIIWRCASNGVFTVKSAYNLFFDEEDLPDSCWDFIWRVNVPPKLKVFLWLMSKGRLLSNEQRVRRQLTSDSSCMTCCGPIESIAHIFKDCSRAMCIWKSMGVPWQLRNAQNLEFKAWLLANLKVSSKGTNEGAWCTLFLFICWHIWKWRNKQIFDVNFVMPMYPKAIIERDVDEWLKACVKYSVKLVKRQISLSWDHPDVGWCKLNVDGSRRTNSGRIGAGGVLRDHNGNWLGGFAVNLGQGQVCDAELWSLYFGLQLAIDKGATELHIEMDSKAVIMLLKQSQVDNFHPLETIMHSCRLMMRQLRRCELNHVYREKNIVADQLANWSYNMDIGVLVFDEPPVWIRSALIDDGAGVPRTRFAVGL